MLDIKLLRENKKLVEEALAKRGAALSLKTFYEKDEQRLELLRKVEDLKHKRNMISKDIGIKKSQSEDASVLLQEVKSIGSSIDELNTNLTVLEQELNGFVLAIPNIPHASVVYGRTSEDNPVVKTWGQKREFAFTPYAHDDLAVSLDIIDFEKGAKIATSGFSLSKGPGALLERALINYFLDVHTKEQGYTEVFVPFMVNAGSMTGTGQLPKFKDDLFKIEGEDLYMIPTSEVPITNIHAQEILEKSALPRYYTAYSPCFRKEAGSYGKDTKGLIRQHQFNKVEIVKLVEPQSSYDELESLLLDAEVLLQKLGLHYRVVSLCSGDLGFSAAKTYDIEVWLPGQNEYREISSCSNFEDFQARRAGIKYRPSKGEKPVYVHTLNGSGLAVGRTVVAILENYQQEDQSVVIPDALRPYTNGVTMLKPVEK